MALRVLLADESSTIKKVFQLALQDYGVDVRSVNVGLDVVETAKKLQPDIVFADVLLQKRNGYEVCSDIKGDNELTATPVVLIWSGFMELDQDKFQACQANAQLEKPFDVNALRKIVQDLVPKTKTQDLSKFINFPKMPEFEDQNQSNAGAGTPSPQAGEEASGEVWDMESFEPIDNVVESEDMGNVPLNFGEPDEESFQEVSLTSIKAPSEIDHQDLDTSVSLTDTPVSQPPQTASADEFLIDNEEEAEDSNWVSQDINEFKLDVSEDLESADDMPVDYVIPDEPAEMEKPKSRGPIKLEMDDMVDEAEDLPPTPLTKPNIKIGAGNEAQSSGEDDLDLEIEELEDDGHEITAPNMPARVANAKTSGQLTPDQIGQMEHIIREQAKEMIEKVVWQVVPDLASQIIERELNRMLEEYENKEL